MSIGETDVELRDRSAFAGSKAVVRSSGWGAGPHDLRPTG
jgi:hypothetical protein